ncbi:MAG: ester cyclase [Pseudomonadota bacterium]
MSEPQAIIAQFYADVDNPHKTKADLADYFTDDFKDLDRHPLAPEFLSDKDAHLGFFDELKGGFKDFTHTLNLVEETNSGRWIVYWTFRGTHIGAFYGTPASNTVAGCNGIDIYTLREGRFSEQRHAEDVAGLMAQLNAA